jgi:membrane protein DedA with SNARE-associated domain
VSLGAAAAAAAALALDLVELPDVEKLIEEAPERLGDGAYAFAGLMGFLELGTLLGVPFPFEVGVILAGAVAGEGEIAFVPLVAIVFVCSAVGEVFNFWCGRRFGRPFIVRHGPRFGVTAERLARVEDHFARHGAATVLIGRFIPLVRSSAPFVAGSSLMPWARFVPFSVAGNLAWAAAFCGLGYAFYRSADDIADVVGSIGLGVFALVVAAALIAYLLARRRARIRSLGWDAGE